VKKDINENRHSCNRPQDPASGRLAAAVAPVGRDVSRAGWLSVVATLLWVGMAAAVALAIGGLIEGRATSLTLALATAAFVAIGLLRAWLGLRAARLLDRAADMLMARERAALVAAQDRLSPRASRLSSAASAPFS
jgi:ATP-binding cassette subfamily C protein CydD